MGRRRRDVNLVEAAVELAGGVSAVARKLGVTRQTVYNWMAAGHMLDATYRYVVGLSKLSGVPLEHLARESKSDSSNWLSNRSPTDERTCALAWLGVIKKGALFLFSAAGRASLKPVGLWQPSHTFNPIWRSPSSPKHLQAT
jgi:hypothetical protein